MILGLSGAAGRGGGALVSIGLNIYAVNNFSGPAAEAQKSLKQMENEFRRTMVENLRVARNTFGAMALAGGFVVRGMSQMYRSFAQFEYTMKGTAIVTRATTEEFNAMQRESLRLGETTMFRSKDIAEQMRQMAKSGMDVASIMNNIKAVVAGAGASMEGLDTITQVMIATMSQFQIPSENAMHTMDRLTAAALGSRASVASLGSGLKMAAADFYALGIPLETALGMLMQMSNFGIDATMSGTALGNMLRYMTKGVSVMGTSRQGKALEMLGFTPDDFKTAEGGFKDMVHIFEMFNKRLNEMPQIDKHAAFEGLFGIRGKRGAMPLAIDPASLQRNIDKVSNSQGLAVSNLNKMMETHEGRIQMLISAWDTFRIKFGEAVSPLFGFLTMGLTHVTRLLSFISEGGGIFKGIAKWVFSGAAALLMFKTALWAVKSALAGFTMIFVSNRVSHDNMTKSMNIVYDVMRAKILSIKKDLVSVMFLQDMIAAKTMRNAGVMMSTQGNLRRNASGALYVAGGRSMAFGGKNYKGGQLISQNRYIANLKTAKPDLGRMANIANTTSSRNLAAGLGANQGVKAGLFGALGGMAGRGILGKLLGFMMGPWGLALIVLPSILTLVNKALNKNTESVNDNTKVLRDTKVIRRPGYDPEFFDVVKAIERITNQKSIDHYIKTGEGSPETRRALTNATLNVNIDGKRVYEEKLTKDQMRVLNALGE